MTGTEFKEKYRYDFLRCDCCGGDGQSCCETPYGTYVTEIDSSLLVADGATITVDGRETTYTIGGNSVTVDGSGWGAVWDLDSDTPYCAFQSWQNGETQFSGIYTGGEVEGFIEGHNESGTFATLHVFQTRNDFMDWVNDQDEDVQSRFHELIYH